MTRAAADTADDQRELAAAVLMALAVLPACHLRAGVTMSVTTETRQGENVPRVNQN